MKLHAPLFPLALCLMAGIAAGRWLGDWTVGLAVLVPLVVVTCLLSRCPRWQTAALWACMAVLGATLGARVKYHDSRKAINQQSYLMRQQLTDRYRQWGISDGAMGVVAAMTLGEKSQLDRGLKETYSRAGASHILALSGLHLMIIYAFVSLFISWRRFRTVSQVVIVAALWAFAYLTGMSPSVVRSAFMISLYALLSLGYRERMSVNTLALTAIVMLVVNPQSLYDISFQLSFMAVLAILLFNPLFNLLIPLHVQQRHRWLRVWWGMTAVSLSAQLGTAPLVAYYFGRFSTWFLLSNYVVIPLATVILYLTLACLLTCWWTWLQHLVAVALSAVVIGMNRLLEAVTQLPFCTVDGLQPSWQQVALIYIIIGSAWAVLSLRFAGVRQSV